MQYVNDPQAMGSSLVQAEFEYISYTVLYSTKAYNTV